MDAEGEVNTLNVETEGAIVVETVNEVEEGETEEYRRYPSRLRHKTSRYKPKFQSRRYKYGSMLIDCEGTL